MPMKLKLRSVNTFKNVNDYSATADLGAAEAEKSPVDSLPDIDDSDLITEIPDDL